MRKNIDENNIEKCRIIIEKKNVYCSLNNSAHQAWNIKGN